MKAPILIPDGTLLGMAPSGTAWRTFSPPWWRLDRWIGWWWRAWRGREGQGRVTFRVQGGEAFEVRVMDSKTRIPGVPTPQHKRLEH